MSVDKNVTEIQHLRLAEIKLLSLSYRKVTSGRLPSYPEERHFEISIKYSIHARRKNSFKIKATHEYKVEGVLFRTRHEARFLSDSIIPKNIHQQEKFRTQITNLLLPFASELFATLTGKSFTIPLIAPGKIRSIGEAED